MVTTIRLRRCSPHRDLCFDLCNQQRSGIHHASRRARRGIPIRRRIPYHGWMLDADSFRTNASTTSSITKYWRIQSVLPADHREGLDSRMGTHASFAPPRSPRATSSRVFEPDLQGGGAITGGLTDFVIARIRRPRPRPAPHFELRRRHHVCLGVRMLSTNICLRIGFVNAFPGQPYPGDYLPQHTSFDLTLGKDFGESFSASVVR